MIDIEAFKPYEGEVIETYRAIHLHPELGFEEVRTSSLVRQKLESWGIPVQSGIAITGVVGTLDSGRPGKTVMLRADMDALPVIEASGLEWSSQEPGKMHACGHDSHVSMLLGAAKYLSEHRDSFSGKIKFVFQPAEEGISKEKTAEIDAMNLGGNDGAIIMINQGVMEGVDGCFAIHVHSGYPKGTMRICKSEAMAAGDTFRLTIKGTGGHGSAPHRATDPVSALSAVIAALQGIPARDISALERCVVNIGTIETPGSRPNVIPANIFVSGTVRTYKESVRTEIFEILEKRAVAAAKLYDCDCEFSRSRGYDATINDENMSRLAAEVADGLLGSDNIDWVDIPDMGSENVGYFFKKAPGVLAWLGAADPKDKSPAMLHSPYMKLDTGAFINGVAMHVNFALAFLSK